MLAEYVPFDNTGLGSLGDIAHSCRQNGVAIVRPTVFRKESNQSLPMVSPKASGLDLI